MPLRLDIEPGSEHLLPFAKKKLADLNALANGPINTRVFVNTGEDIFVQRGVVDLIRIRGGGSPIGWGLYGEVQPNGAVFTKDGVLSSTLRIKKKYPKLVPDGVGINAISYSSNVDIVGHGIKDGSLVIWFVSSVNKGGMFAYASADGYSPGRLFLKSDGSMIVARTGMSSGSAIWKHYITQTDNPDGTISVTADSYVLTTISDFSSLSPLGSGGACYLDRDCTWLAYFFGDFNHGFTARIVNIQTGVTVDTPITIKNQQNTPRAAQDYHGAPGLSLYKEDVINAFSAALSGAGSYWNVMRFDSSFDINDGDILEDILDERGDLLTSAQMEVWNKNVLVHTFGEANDGTAYIPLQIFTRGDSDALVVLYVRRVYDGPANIDPSFFTLNTLVSSEQRVAVFDASGLVLDASLGIPISENATAVFYSADVVYVTSAASPVGIAVIERAGGSWAMHTVEVDPKSPSDPLGPGVRTPAEYLLPATSDNVGGSFVTGSGVSSFGGFMLDGSWLYKIGLAGFFTPEEVASLGDDYTLDDIIALLGGEPGDTSVFIPLRRVYKAAIYKAANSGKWLFSTRVYGTQPSDPFILPPAATRLFSELPHVIGL